jgi:hypothetical protein
LEQAHVTNQANQPDTTNPESELDFLRGESLTGSQLVEIGELAQELARVIRGHLPLLGRAEIGTSRRPDQWYREAVALYERIERVRNPNRLPYVKNRHCAPYFLDVHPEFDRKDYHELGDALDYLCEIYNWKALSHGSGTVGKGGQPGEKPPAVSPEMIDRLDAAGRRLTTTALPTEGGPWCNRLVLQSPRSTPSAAEEKPLTKRRANRRVTVDEANRIMLEAIEDELRGLERMKWTIREWKQHIDTDTGGNCSTSTIYATPAWKQYAVARERAKQELKKSNRGRRRPQHRSQY